MENLNPITRKEHFLAKAAGSQAAKDLDPITREEWFISQIRGGGEGGSVTPSAVASAISQMSDAQAAQALADLGYTVDTALDEDSSNPVQNSALTQMLTWAQMALNRKVDKTTVTRISGASVTITPEDNYEYVCGELASLTISNPPATGKYSIIFYSGSTATTTIGIENFVAEANKRYKITVEDNYATYDSWPYTPA